MKTEDTPMLIGFEERMLPMLRARVVERRGRRRGRRSVFMIAAVAVLVIGTGSVGGRLAGRGQRIEIDAVKALENPAAVIADLRRAGVTAKIYSVPLGVGSNYRPGVWVDVGYDNPDPTTLGAWFNTWWGHRILSLPRGIHGTVSLFVGRTPLPDEVPAPSFLDNELGPTGDFWCLALETMSPMEATKTLEDLGYEVRWEFDLPVDENGIGEAEEVTDLPPGATLVRAALPNDPGIVRFQFVDASFSENERRSWGAPSEAAPRSAWASWAPKCT
jgi:hypothetical protein